MSSTIYKLCKILHKCSLQVHPHFSILFFSSELQPLAKQPIYSLPCVSQQSSFLYSPSSPLSLSQLPWTLETVVVNVIVVNLLRGYVLFSFSLFFQHVFIPFSSGARTGASCSASSRTHPRSNWGETLRGRNSGSLSLSWARRRTCPRARRRSKTQLRTRMWQEASSLSGPILALLVSGFYESLRHFPTILSSRHHHQQHRENAVKSLHPLLYNQFWPCST